MAFDWDTGNVWGWLCHANQQTSSFLPSSVSPLPSSVCLMQHPPLHSKSARAHSPGVLCVAFTVLRASCGKVGFSGQVTFYQ